MIRKTELVCGFCHGACRRCEVAIGVHKDYPERWPHWSYSHTYRTPKMRTYVHIDAICGLCAMIEESMLIAANDGARFSTIQVMDRCVCGRVLLERHRMNELCVTCWREDRMLTKARRDTSMALRVIREISRTAKDMGG